MGGLGHLQPEFSILAGRLPSEPFLSLSGQSPGGLIPGWISSRHLVPGPLCQARHRTALCLHTHALGDSPRAHLVSVNVIGGNTISTLPSSESR